MLIEVTHAMNQGSSILGPSMEFGDFILLAISIFVLASGILSIVFILWGGLLLILSGGKDEKIKPAINTIRFAVIGIIITVLTIFIFPVFGRLLGLDVDKYANPSAIFQTIEDLGNKIFGNNSSSFSTGEDIDNLDNFPTDFSDL